MSRVPTETASVSRWSLIEGARSAVGVIYAAYALTLTLITGAMLWPLVVLAPTSHRFRLDAVRVGGTILRWLVGVRLNVVGTVATDGPVVIVANHSSFVDGLVMILAIDRPATYVVGAVFEHQPVIGRFLTGLGCLFAGGGTPSEATAVTDRLTASVHAGESLVVFPEGGLSSTPGVRRFRLGALRAAADAGVPVVPVGISGTRSIVPPGGRHARPGAIRVEIGAAITADGTDWRSLVALRESVRSAVSDLSDEAPVAVGDTD